VWNTHTNGRYVGSIIHGLVVGLLKVRAYTWVQLCGVCRGMLAVGKTPDYPWMCSLDMVN
jgi:hypothetical protein